MARVDQALTPREKPAFYTARTEDGGKIEALAATPGTELVWILYLATDFLAMAAL